MTIEALLKANNEKLDRIASALEAIVDSQGIVVSASEQTELPLDESDDDLDESDDDLDDGDDLDDDDDDDLDDETPARSKKTSKKKASKKKKKVSKKASKKKTSKASKNTDEKSPTKADVRAALKDLQVVSGSAAKSKSILSKHGASQLGQLDETKYKRAIADARAAIDEYELPE